MGLTLGKGLEHWQILNQLKETGGGPRDKRYEGTAEIVQFGMDDRPKEMCENKGPEGEERRE